MSSSSSSPPRRPGGAESDRDTPGGLLEIGRIEKPHGLRGEVVVRLFTNMVGDRTEAGTVVWADDRPLTIVAARPHGPRWLVTFDGVVGREAADALRGVTLRAEPLSTDGADPGPVAEAHTHGGEVVAFVHELIGRRLVDQDGTDHGPVTAVVENPASDLLELGDGRLVPLTFYRGSDPEAGTITVDVPAGLLD